MKLLASVLLLGLALMSHEVHGQGAKMSSGLPYYCPDKPGVHYYADVITSCRAFHLCAGSEPLHFLCPTGLVFNENARVCDFPSNVECKSSSEVLHLLGLRGERIPLNDEALESLQAVVSIPHKIKTSSYYLTELLNKFSSGLSDTKTESSSSSQTKSPVNYSKYEPTEPSYVDEKLVEMLIRRTEELENSGELVASNVDSYVLPPASPGYFTGDNSNEMDPSEEVLQHIISHQISESEKIKPPGFPRNGALFKDIIKPIFTAVVSDRSTLINIKRALLSGLVELKPIVVELLRMRDARAKRSVEESSSISILNQINLQDDVPPMIEGSESQMLAIEKKTVQKFEDISDYFKQFLDVMSSDEAFRLAVIDELVRIIETESLLDDFEELLQLPSHQMRRKRFVNLSSPIVLPRELVENVKAGLQAHTKPIIKDILSATLPTALRVASENVPLLLDVVDSLKPLLKDRFPTLLQHTASLVTKYDRYKYSNPGSITLPPPAEMISDFLPYALAGLEMGGEYMRKNPNAISTLFFGRDGILSKIFSTNYRPPLRAVQQQSVPVRSRYQPSPSVNSAQHQRIMHSIRPVSSRLAAVRRG